MPISVLPPELASQIAAGEVVERPASIVKELIENALDAGATRIVVGVRSGGLEEIEVDDDGVGMNESDARLSLERHATSKLRQMADLDTLGSYGFRGEALPSIASVSRLRLVTRARESEQGTELACDGPEVTSLRPAGSKVGTRVTVRDLFWNVPARKKFLRSTSTEAGHVTAVVSQAALSFPEVTFQLVRDGRLVRTWPSAASRSERAQDVLDGEVLERIAGERGPLRIEAYLSSPERARRGATGLELFVNRRPVRDRGLFGTIAHAYGPELERGHYPRGVVYLELPGHLVDVNVHPQKLEVRFADARAVSDAVYGLVSRALSARAARALAAKSEPAPPATKTDLSARQILDGEPEKPDFAAPPRPAAQLLRDGTGVSRHGYAPSASTDVRRYALSPSGDLDAEDPSTAERATWKNLRFIRQVRRTFLLCEGNDGIYVLDQHAAAERVAWSRLKSSYGARTVATQALLFPLVVDVSPEEAELVEARQDAMAALGLDVRVRGSDKVSVHGVPRLLANGSPERLLRDLLRELGKKDDRAYSSAIDQVLVSMACHAAVRAGDVITAPEAETLLRDLALADFAGPCPHGRPIVAVLSFSDLERKVGRR